MRRSLEEVQREAFLTKKKAQHEAEAREALWGSEMQKLESKVGHHVEKHTKTADEAQRLSALVVRTKAEAADAIATAKEEWDGDMISLNEEVSLLRVPLSSFAALPSSYSHLFMNART